MNFGISLIESAQESAAEVSEQQSDIEPSYESEVDEEQLQANKLADEERRQQEQKQREIEMARLAELEEIASQEREAELARQAAELAGNYNLSGFFFFCLFVENILITSDIISIANIVNSIFSIELARQQEAEARKQQEEDEATASESHSVVEEFSEGPQSSKYTENDDVDNDEDIVINREIVDATDDDAQSVGSADGENSKYESEEETE